MKPSVCDIYTSYSWSEYCLGLLYFVKERAVQMFKVSKGYFKWVWPKVSRLSLFGVIHLPVLWVSYNCCTLHYLQCHTHSQVVYTFAPHLRFGLSFAERLRARGERRSNDSPHHGVVSSQPQGSSSSSDADLPSYEEAVLLSGKVNDAMVLQESWTW